MTNRKQNVCTESTNTAPRGWQVRWTDDCGSEHVQKYADWKDAHAVQVGLSGAGVRAHLEDAW